MNMISYSELESETVELLPEKETLFFNNNWAGIYASNSSLALNVASVFANAQSNATQVIGVVQH
ncbi:hypothetical protein ACWEOW_11525 [Monashia sp. NPDC004114]